jgi:hypothetical protein
VNRPEGQLGIKYPKYIKMRDWLNIRLDELMCYLMNVSYLLSKRHEHTLGIPYHGYITVVGLNMDEHSNWLVVSTYPSEKIWVKVSWDDEISNIWKNNPTVPNHQPGIIHYMSMMLWAWIIHHCSWAILFTHHHFDLLQSCAIWTLAECQSFRNKINR